MTSIITPPLSIWARPAFTAKEDWGVVVEEGLAVGVGFVAAIGEEIVVEGVPLV